MSLWSRPWLSRAPHDPRRRRRGRTTSWQAFRGSDRSVRRPRAPRDVLFLPLCFRGTATHLSRRTVAVLTCAPRVFPDGTIPAARSPLGHLGPRSRAQDVTAQVQATGRHRGANQLQTQSPARAGCDLDSGEALGGAPSDQVLHVLLAHFPP